MCSTLTHVPSPLEGVVQGKFVVHRYPPRPLVAGLGAAPEAGGDGVLLEVQPVLLHERRDLRSRIFDTSGDGASGGGASWRKRLSRAKGRETERASRRRKNGRMKAETCTKRSDGGG